MLLATAKSKWFIVRLLTAIFFMQLAVANSARASGGESR